MFNFDVLNRFDHAELATMHAPRPYMVENGLRDTVAPTVWVDNEFRRVQGVYESLGAGEAAVLSHFDGPHRMWGEESLLFLKKYLKQGL